MAGLTVRDPAVDRSLRSVFGERNSVEPSIGEGQKKTGIGEECPPAPHRSPRGLQFDLPIPGGQPGGLVGKVMLPFPRGFAAFSRCG